MLSAILKQPYLDTWCYFAIYFIVAFTGLAVGSFLNVCIYRIPLNQSISKRASHCMTCGAKIRYRDLVPVFSWLFLRGKCHNCGEKISARYPIVESLNCILCILAVTVFDINAKSIICCIFFSLLIVIAFIDWDTLEMNVSLLIAIGLLAVVSFFLTDDLTLLNRIIGGICISVPFFLIGEISGAVIKKSTGEKIRGIELGDTILMAVSGLLIGYKAVIVSAFIGIIAAAIVGIIKKQFSEDSKLPFGPFLAIGLVIGSLCGEQLLNLYIDKFIRV